MVYKIPKEVREIGAVLEKNGFEAYIVGGCVRDLLLSRAPEDWDIATNAKPDEIQNCMQEAGWKTFYENEFFTVGVVWPQKKLPQGKVEEIPFKLVEITTYRSEAKYTDKRHPDSIEFASSLELDLRRRDFTVNAMAIKLKTKNEKRKIEEAQVIDLFGGQSDLEQKIIRAVGDPQKRFSEDALRMMRGVRLAVQLEFDIEPQTARAVRDNAGLLQFIAMERVRDEFSKLILSPAPRRGLEMLRELGLLTYALPELEEGIDVGQNKHHVYTVWEHNLRAAQCAADKKWALVVRLASLLHDVAKPKCKEGDGPESTFYGHDVVGAKMAARALDRLRYPKDIVEKVRKLIRYHLFYYNVDEVSESSVRRLIRKVGREDMEDLISVRICDRIGSGVPKAEPYKLRHFRFLVEKLGRDPISVGMLRVGGNDVMRIADIPPGPQVGFLLNILLEEVLDDPALNKKMYLEKRLGALAKMSADELQQLANAAKKKTIALEEAEVGEIKKKHWVR